MRKDKGIGVKRHFVAPEIVQKKKKKRMGTRARATRIVGKKRKIFKRLQYAGFSIHRQLKRGEHQNLHIISLSKHLLCEVLYNIKSRNFVHFYKFLNIVL